MRVLLIIICFVLFSNYGKTQFGTIIKGAGKVVTKLKPIPKLKPIDSRNFNNYSYVNIKDNDTKRFKDFTDVMDVMDVMDVTDSISNILSKPLEVDQIMFENSALTELLSGEALNSREGWLSNPSFDLLELDSIQKNKYLRTDNKVTFLDDEFLFLNSVNNSVEQNMSVKYGKTSNINKNTRGIHESYLDQKLQENVNKELVNFNREINSIVIKSKNIDFNHEYINKSH